MSKSRAPQLSTTANRPITKAAPKSNLLRAMNTAAFRAGANHGLLWLVVLALFGSLISLYYYLIVLKVIFQTQGAERAWQSSPVENGLARLTIAFAAAAVLFLGIAPQFLVTRILAALP